MVTTLQDTPGWVLHSTLQSISTGPVIHNYQLTIPTSFDIPPLLKRNYFPLDGKVLYFGIQVTANDDPAGVDFHVRKNDSSNIATHSFGPNETGKKEDGTLNEVVLTGEFIQLNVDLKSGGSVVTFYFCVVGKL